MTLTDVSPSPGIAIFNLDDVNAPVQNFTHPSFRFIDGIGIAPEQNRVLLVQGGTYSDAGALIEPAKLHVVRVDSTAPTLERSIDLPTTGSQSYFGGIAVRPSGNMCFIATGRAWNDGAAIGTSLVQVGYTGSIYATESFPGLPAHTWAVRIESLGTPAKPHIFVCSVSGALSIIPC